MGFQDEIDDEDFRGSTSNPAPLDLSSSSDEESQAVAVQPSLSLVSNIVEDVDTGLDDWLNSSQVTQPQPAEVMSSDPVQISSSSSDLVDTPKANKSTKKKRRLANASQKSRKNQGNDQT